MPYPKRKFHYILRLISFTLLIAFFIKLRKSNILPHDEFIHEIMTKRVDITNKMNLNLSSWINLSPSNFCHTTNSNLLFTALVIIAPNSFHKRQLIRATWANQTLFSSKLRVIFVVGMSPYLEVNKQIQTEFNMHQDILQLKLLDSYFRITKKLMIGFKWVHTYCSNSKYVLRINEDVFVNTFALIRLFTNDIVYKRRQIYGWLNRNFTTYVDRRENEKFFVSRKDYACDQYPDYPSGKSF